MGRCFVKTAVRFLSPRPHNFYDHHKILPHEQSLSLDVARIKISSITHFKISSFLRQAGLTLLLRYPGLHAPPIHTMVGKRRRDTATPNTELIEIYEDLANEDQEIRLRAAHNLLSKFASPPWSSPEKIKPIVIRLFRGLCSSRKAARPGFSVAITELLTQIFQSPVNETGLSLDDVLEILEKHTVPDGATTGQVTQNSNPLVVDHCAE